MTATISPRNCYITFIRNKLYSSSFGINIIYQQKCPNQEFAKHNKLYHATHTMLSKTNKNESRFREILQCEVKELSLNKMKLSHLLNGKYIWLVCKGHVIYEDR